MMKMRSGRHLAWLAAVCMLLAACGGGGGGANDILGGEAGVPAGTAGTRFTNAAGIVLDNNTLFTPSGPLRGAVVMLHGCAGAGSSLYTRWGEQLAAQGYLAMLVDSFGPRGATDECGNGSAGVSEVADRPLDALAAYDFLVTQRGVPPQKVALLGWSHGGSSVLATLWSGQTRQPFAGGFAFYPGCGLWNAIPDPYPYAPLAIHYGDNDATTSAAPCAELEEGEQADHGTNHLAITLYAGAGHSFDNALARCGSPTCDNYGQADGRTLTQADFDARNAADAAVLATLGQWFAP